MAPPIPTEEPKTLAAGETAQWTRQIADYPPSDGWTLVYYFAGPDTFTVTATSDPATGLYTATIASSDTTAKPDGLYEWRAYAETGTGATYERHEVGRGALALEPDWSAIVGNGQQAFAEQMVAAIEAALLGRAGADLEQYGIAGRQVQKIKFADLHAELGIWKAKLYRLRRNTSFVSHPVRFHVPR